MQIDRATGLMSRHTIFGHDHAHPTTKRAALRVEAMEGTVERVDRAPHSIVMQIIFCASKVVSDSSGCLDFGASLSRNGHLLREDRTFELLSSLVAKTKPACIINTDSGAN